MTIGIIGAMDEEITYLKNHMKITCEKTIANTLFIQGQLGIQKIVLLKSGIGKVNAAMATTILHEQFQPDYIINTGSAGGLSKELSVGDIVISTEVLHHDVDVTVFDYSYGQVPNLPPTFHADQKLIDKTLEAANHINLPFKQGVIATGDSFMNDKKHSAMVKRKIPKLIAAEMEAAAVAQVCYQYETPFVIIRALSDIAGEDSAISFNDFLDTAAKNSTSLIIQLVNKL